MHKLSPNMDSGTLTQRAPLRIEKSSNKWESAALVGVVAQRNLQTKIPSQISYSDNWHGLNSTHLKESIENLTGKRNLNLASLYASRSTGFSHFSNNFPTSRFQIPLNAVLLSIVNYVNYTHQELALWAFPDVSIFFKLANSEARRSSMVDTPIGPVPESLPFR